MGYYLIDVDNNYLGDFATAFGIEELRKYATKVQALNLLGFLEKGAALITAVLINEVKGLRPTDENIRGILDNLVRMLDDADLCVIIQDGVTNASED